MLQTQADEFLDYVIKEWANIIQTEATIGYEFLDKSARVFYSQTGNQESGQNEEYSEVQSDERLASADNVEASLQESYITTGDSQSN